MKRVSSLIIISLNCLLFWISDLSAQSQLADSAKFETRDGLKTTFYDNGNKCHEVIVLSTKKITVVNSKHKRKEKVVCDKTITIDYWYNGKKKEEECPDSVMSYYSNGQRRAIGYLAPDPYRERNQYFSDSMQTAKTNYLNHHYFCVMELETLQTVVNGFQGAIRDTSGRPTVTRLISYGERPWTQSWYRNGAVNYTICYDNVKQGIVKKDYYPDGSINSVGVIRYGIFENTPSDTLAKEILLGTTGYLKSGIWEFYAPDKTLLEKKDYDKEPMEKRRIEW
jgi:antitoxin component YwqK of YwqJK toxin-antitoxin module